jgi:hypothetical protein
MNNKIRLHLDSFLAWLEPGSYVTFWLDPSIAERGIGEVKTINIEVLDPLQTGTFFAQGNSEITLC